MNKQVKKELPDLAILYYSGDTPGSVKEADLADVKCRWLQCSLLLYTSTLTVGVSADIHELEEEEDDEVNTALHYVVSPAIQVCGLTS